MTTAPGNDLALIPSPRQLTLEPGCFEAPAELVLSVSPNARRLQAVAGAEGVSVQVEADGPDFGFRLGAPTAAAPTPPDHNEGYAIDIGPDGVQAAANSYPGLVHAWFALAQIRRQCGGPWPCLQISDYPDLDWRIYHLDLKGTRRRRENLHAILPELAEFKVNALLVEYEDYIRLERHPDLAVPEALSKDEWAAWIEDAEAHGLTVIPLVQTLGHWQYILCKPAYAHLQEHPGDAAEACSSHPETWQMVRDFIDEIAELHPNAPFLHVGLDETARIATCPRCRERLGDDSRLVFYARWMNRVCAYVRDRGLTPMAWGDMIINEPDDEVTNALDPDVVLLAWDYGSTGPSRPAFGWHGQRLSREWLKRPNADIADLPTISFRPGMKFYEDLEPSERESLAPYIDRPDSPRRFASHPGVPMLRQRGFRTMGVAASRTSSHGCIAPHFIVGQLNIMCWAQTCRKHGGEGVIASSWARGHSLAGLNAHPDLEWYAIAALGESGWRPFELSELREFDARFAREFFGLPDGHVADLYFLFDRSSPRVDHNMVNYLDHVSEELAKLLPLATRNRGRLELFARVVELQRLRVRCQFALLEIEYFYPLWGRVPIAMRERIFGDIEAVAAEMAASRTGLAELYAETLVESDARELAATQIDFFRDSMLLMRDNLKSAAASGSATTAPPNGEN